MVNAHNQPGTTDTAIPHHEHGMRRRDIALHAGTVTGIDVRNLPAETELTVDTSNSRYRFVMLEDRGSRALVRGGRYFGDDTEARIEGSTLGGTLLRRGWIGLGLPMELTVEGKILGTSRVQSITISAASDAA